jgi:hypothetical protein
MRTVLLGWVSVAGLGGAAVAQAPGAAPPPRQADRALEDSGKSPATLDAGARREQIVSKLKNVRISLEFADTPLPEALDFIRSFSGIDFVIDAKVRERYPDDQLKVSLKVRDIPLESALKLLLGSRSLGAVYRDGVLLIVLKEDLDKDVALRMYDVRDLLMKIQDHPGPTIELKPPGTTGGVAGATFSLDEAPKQLTEEFIVDIVKKNCGGTTWEQNPNASITLSNGLLMVVQSRRVHGEIQQLLGLLRQYK